MDLKAILIDVDGTLLTDDQRISERTLNVLLNAQQKGIRVILASGRPSSGMTVYAEALRLKHFNGYVVSYNGACVVDAKTSKIVHEAMIDGALARQFLAHCEPFGLVPMIVKGNTLVVNDAYPEPFMAFGKLCNIVEVEAREAHLKVREEPLKTYVDFPVYKVIIAGPEAKIQAHAEAIYSPFKATLSSALSAPFFLEFTRKGVNKAQAIDILLTSLGIQSSQTIAFGDSHNDLEMIQFAKHGVAMRNAVEAVKEIADVVTASNNEDGIADVLEKFI